MLDTEVLDVLQSQLQGKRKISFLVGTSGATNLPKRIVDTVLAKSSFVVDINPRENEFTRQLEKAKNGYWIQGKSGEVLPLIEAQIRDFLF